MATGGGDDREEGNPWRKIIPEEHRRKPQRHQSRNDIGNQGRFLINTFIHDRMTADHIQQQQIHADDVFGPGTPEGLQTEQITEVALALRVIGDELDRDEKLQNMISRISPDAPEQTFMNVAREIFSDGVFNWGRVVALFYFGYKMVVKALDRLPLIKTIIDWIVKFIVDYVAPWIMERGGWEAIQEYFGTPAVQAVGIFAGGRIKASGEILSKYELIKHVTRVSFVQNSSNFRIFSCDHNNLVNRQFL